MINSSDHESARCSPGAKKATPKPYPSEYVKECAESTIKNLPGVREGQPKRPLSDDVDGVDGVYSS